MDWTAEAIRELRKTMRMSLAEFAAAGGFSRWITVQWEHGRMRPMPHNLRKLDKLKREYHRLAPKLAVNTNGCRGHRLCNQSFIYCGETP